MREQTREAILQRMLDSGELGRGDWRMRDGQLVMQGKEESVAVGVVWTTPIADGDGHRRRVQGEDGFHVMLLSRDGRQVHRKIGPRQEGRILWGIENALITHQSYYGVGNAFIDETSTALGSWVPNVQMVDRLPWSLSMSLISALALPGVIVVILRIIHGFGMKRKISAQNYLVGGSFKLNYARDVFIRTHTARTKIPKETSSSSGGGFGGSSGGGTSSGSSGRF